MNPGLRNQLQSIPKHYRRSWKNKGVSSFNLYFSGPTPCLDIDIDWARSVSATIQRRVRNEIENWAWNVYDLGKIGGYSRKSGDADEYGDTIVYNLEKDSVEHQPWEMQKTFGELSGTLCMDCKEPLQETSRTETGYICLKCRRWQSNTHLFPIACGSIWLSLSIRRLRSGSSR
jgi:hypothetical protein